MDKLEMHWRHALPLLLALPVCATGAQPASMADLSIEELANIQITSVSKKPQGLAGAAASVFVITADDIRRSGALTLVEALRLAPNLQVAQTSGYDYAISARGLNGSNNSGPNKLQVLIDGRSVYAPIFSGVIWDVQQVMLEDIERIEVISGPGGTLWGSNAVNGVINISTRQAGDSRGTLISAAAGQHGADLAFRQGGKMSGGAWRAYGSYLDHRHTERASGAPVDDARHFAQVGLRADWSRGADQFSLSGNAYRGAADQAAPGALQTGAPITLGPMRSSGAHLTGQWRRQFDDGGSVSIQAYLDHSERQAVPTYAQRINIADVQFQHSLAARGVHHWVWGASYRSAWDRINNSVIVAFLPARSRMDWASLFAQDDVALSERLRLTVGARVERNDYTGSEWLPTVRLAWSPTPAHTVWGGVSRTVRAPSRLDVDTFIPGLPPYLLRGGPQVRSEVARVIELGYRGQPLPGLSYAVTAFHNDYDHFRTQEFNQAGGFVTFDSLMEGRAHGVEMWGNAQLTPRWRVSAGWTLLHQQMQLKAGSNDAAGPTTAGKDPSHMAQVRSSFALSDAVEFDVALRKVAALRVAPVPGYLALDARLGWNVRPGLTLSLAGQNLNGSHGEYGAEQFRTEVGRTVALKLVWER